MCHAGIIFQKEAGDIVKYVGRGLYHYANFCQHFAFHAEPVIS